MHPFHFTALPAKVIFGFGTIAGLAEPRMPREGVARVVELAPASRHGYPPPLEESHLRRLLEHGYDGRLPA